MTTKEQIEQLDIPKSLIAELSDSSPSDISLFLRNENLVSEAKRQRIRKTTKEIAELVENFGPTLPVGTTLNFKNAVEIKRLIFLRQSNVSSILSGEAAAI